MACQSMVVPIHHSLRQQHHRLPDHINLSSHICRALVLRHLGHPMTRHVPFMPWEMALIYALHLWVRVPSVRLEYLHHRRAHQVPYWSFRVLDRPAFVGGRLYRVLRLPQHRWTGISRHAFMWQNNKLSCGFILWKPVYFWNIYIYSSVFNCDSLWNLFALK